ncbi:MAG: dethiobiotin synthase [Sulfurospirillaceae bacterium]|nr:dethiobiotin synthase [Sulfurospirillaceae bacterium]
MKLKPLFITATNTNVGKTHTTLKLIESLSAQGLKVGVMKPIETGVEDIPLDANLLFETAKHYYPALGVLKLKDIAPYQFALPAAPYVAKGKKKINLEILETAYAKIEALCDIVLIEGAGGLLVPIEDDLYMYDFIRLFNARTLLVGHSELGCINDILLSLHLLDALGVDDYEWCINFKEDRSNFDKTTLPFFKSLFGRVLSLQDDCEEIIQSLVPYHDIE